MNPDWQRFITTREAGNDFRDPPGHSSGPETATSAIFPIDLYSVLRVSGSDATTFLQGQTTCDVSALQADHAGYGAMCNPKGRVISSFVVTAGTTGYRMVVPASLTEALLKRLRMYILRSDVTIEDVTDQLGIFALRCETLPERFGNLRPFAWASNQQAFADNNSLLVPLGPSRWLYLANPETASGQWLDLCANQNFVALPQGYWNLECIMNGIAHIGPETSEEFVPQMINLDRLGGISFEKGCYTGQEIVARMHYLGKLKRRMYLIAVDARQLPAPGTPIVTPKSDQIVGQIVNAEWLTPATIRALAVIQIDKVESVQLRLEESIGSTIKILELPYTF